MNNQYRARVINGPISTDDIIPGKYKHMYTDHQKMAMHIFENKLPGLSATFQENDVLVCNKIFGIGSSREQAVSSLLSIGIKAVIAPLFGRIFYRNCWNLGLFPIECHLDYILDKQIITINMNRGEIIC